MSDLAIIAGGDEHELAVIEIGRQVEDARARLLDQHPFFHNNQEIPQP